MNLAHFGPGSRPISDNFFFVWKVFLIDFLSKMKSQKGSLGFRMILKWCFLVYSEEIFENNSRVQSLVVLMGAVAYQARRISTNKNGRYPKDNYDASFE